jgi:hypothetical protein
VPARGQQAQQQGPCQRNQEQEERPRGGGTQAAERKQNDSNDVLEDQDANGDPAVVGLEFAAGLQGLGRQDGAGEAQRDGDNYGRGDVEPEHQANRRKEDRADDELYGPRAENLRPEDAAQPEVQPYYEQQQQYPGVADVVQQLAGRCTHAEEREPASQVSHQRGHLQVADGEPQQVGYGYPDRFQRVSFLPDTLRLRAGLLRAKPAPKYVSVVRRTQAPDRFRTIKPTGSS